MIARASLLVLATAFQVISSQGPPPFPPNVPEQCRGPPQGVDKPHDCCKIPPFFSENDFEECGFKKLDDDPKERRGPPDCSKQLCMMKKYNFARADDTIDYEVLGAFLDTWAKANPEFEPAMSKAKEQCVGKPLPGPPQICEPNKIVFCISSTLFGECPKWEETDGCKKLKSHIEECAPFFLKH